MSAENLSKKSDFAKINVSRMSAWLIFFCICLTAVNFGTAQSPSKSDLVFCPLQKTWVKRSEPTAKIELKPFDAICAIDARKEVLKLEFSLKTLRPATEKIIFDYLQKGDEVYAELNQVPNSPSRQVIKQASFEIAAHNFQQDFSKHKTANFTLPQAARPPTFTNASTKLAFPFISELKRISRNINPRSPPILS